jgi:hypothetical protein
LTAIAENRSQLWRRCPSHARQQIHQASLAFETFYFADNSRWSALEYALPSLPGTRQWRMVTPNEFLRSARAGLTVGLG